MLQQDGRHGLEHPAKTSSRAVCRGTKVVSERRVRPLEEWQARLHGPTWPQFGSLHPIASLELRDNRSDHELQPLISQENRWSEYLPVGSSVIPKRLICMR